mgnify:CR=1 FL=1
MADLQKIAEDLSGLTVLEASELTKILEEKWGVSAAAPVAVAAVAAGGGAADGMRLRRQRRGAGAAPQHRLARQRRAHASLVPSALRVQQRP